MRGHAWKRGELQMLDEPVAMSGAQGAHEFEGIELAERGGGG